jgi:hypothetical protein
MLAAAVSMNRAVISVPERYQNTRKQIECKLFFAETGFEGRSSLWCLDQHPPGAIRRERDRSPGPKTPGPRAAPQQRQQHRRRQGSQRVEPDRVRHLKLRQSEQAARQPAQRAIQSGEPVERAQSPGRVGRRRERAQNEKYRGRRRESYSASTVCGSNPTISW